MPALRSLATKLGIAARVRFLGYLGDQAATLAGAQIFALSSHSEAFPRSILEAMRAGLPVVASDVGGVGEAVHDNVSGVLVPAGDAKAFARALAGLVESRAQRQLLGAAARLIYEEQFGFQRMVDKTTAVYANVLCSTTKSAKQSI
jgi:glycosyltransferase involved in cell wall biosynthesis